MLNKLLPELLRLIAADHEHNRRAVRVSCDKLIRLLNEIKKWPYHKKIQIAIFKRKRS